MANQAPSKRDVVPGFGAMLKTAREKRGWTRAELATRARVSPTAVGDIERDCRSPSLRMAAALVKALSLTVYLDQPATPLERHEK